MNVYYDVEDNCYRTYPDGDIASIDQMRELIENKNLSIVKLQQENKQLKDNWDKLRAYIKETKLKEFEKEYGKRYGETFTQAEIVVCNMIMDKMQELEQGSDGNE